MRGGLDFRSEREWVIYTIEEELGKLEGLVKSHQQFSDHELEVLADCQARLNRILTILANQSQEEALPHWLRRKAPTGSTGQDKKCKSA